MPVPRKDDADDDQARASLDSGATASSGDTPSVAPFVDDEDDAKIPDGDATGPTRRSGETSEDASAAPAERTVTRRRVTSKRVTPKGGAAPSPSVSKRKPGRGGEEVETSSRYTPPGTGTYAQGPSPWWVPTLMFGLLIIGALIIMTNYMGVFGEAANIRLVIGLVCILGGIVTATQYR